MFALKRLVMSSFRGEKPLHPLLERFMPKISEGRLLELYPPFFVMRAKFVELDTEWNHVKVRLPLHSFTRNASGVMFGGAQASLADPIAALACLKRLRKYQWPLRLEGSFISGLLS